MVVALHQYHTTIISPSSKRNVMCECGIVGKPTGIYGPLDFIWLERRQTMCLFYCAATTKIMKIIVAGSTGFVATELIKQALSNSAVTSIAALARRTTAVPQNLGPGGLMSRSSNLSCVMTLNNIPKM
ncbi:hypothetical protein OCU04_012489 [Sclerotinia nivalis]|uniref:Uncharacterized protein n=1 Tax=Sclerotinia nivalis TaxID=352851 RepID=A0A9X0A8P9_9HELO|nr:hypothetical protein OCU04_012489 [Sclerotinia nivalis]